MPHVKQAKTLDADKSDDSDNPLRLEGVVEEELGGVQLGTVSSATVSSSRATVVYPSS